MNWACVAVDRVLAETGNYFRDDQTLDLKLEDPGSGPSFLKSQYDLKL